MNSRLFEVEIFSCLSEQIFYSRFEFRFTGVVSKVYMIRKSESAVSVQSVLSYYTINVWRVTVSGPKDKLLMKPSEKLTLKRRNL